MNTSGLIFRTHLKFRERAKYEIDDMNGNVDILSVSPTKMQWKYDEGDIITFRKRIAE